MTAQTIINVSDLIKPTPKQRECFQATDKYRFTLYGGAAGGGKSYMLRWWCLRQLINLYAETGIKGLVAGLFSIDYPTLQDRQISKIAKEFPEWHLQHVVGPYIADIFIPYAKLVIEADGATHAGRKQYDQRRETYMRNRGLRTIRFQNIEVHQDLQGVVSKCLEACGELKPFVAGEVQITYCPPMRASGRKGATKRAEIRAFRPW